MREAYAVVGFVVGIVCALAYRASREDRWPVREPVTVPKPENVHSVIETLAERLHDAG